MMFVRSLISIFFFFIFFASNANASSLKQTYLIHTVKSNTKSIVASLLNSLQTENLDDDDFSLPEIHYIYENAMSGFSATLTDDQLETVKNTRGFISAYPDELLSLHTTHSPKFLGLQYGIGLWNQTSLASDVIVGLVDTGISPEHVSFRDTHMPPVPSRWRGSCDVGTNFSASSCNKKIIGASAFYKGYESIVGKINETTDFRSARDSQGHGTHTASTAAGGIVPRASYFGQAKGAFASGMRFSSRIAAYKACWALGCANTDVMAAIDRAILDGVDVISLSLGGSSRPFYVDPVAIAGFGAMQKNIFVSCSAGNSGPTKSTVSNGAPWLMTVAASYTDRTFPAIVRLGSRRNLVGSSLYKGRSLKNLPLAFNRTAGEDTGAEFCVANSLKRELVEGKIVICLRGASGRTAKGAEVKRAGGVAMLLVSRETEGEELLADPHVLPAVSIGFSDGKILLKYLAGGGKATVASIRFRGTRFNATAPIVAAFSSRGPSVAGPEVVKPDISAPGLNILAGWSPFSSPSLLRSDPRRVQFNIISGTSMACPHISGIAALIKSVHGDWSPAMIKSALMTTARITDNRNQPIGDMGAGPNAAATAFDFGGGDVDPTRAVDPGLVYDLSTVDYLNYFCSLNYTRERILLFSGTNYTCPASPGDLNYPSFAVNFGNGAKLKTVTSKRTVTNVGTPACEYVAHVEEPKGVKVKVEPKVLKFQKARERLSYTVTFASSRNSSFSASSSFGALVWICDKYTVRSPIAVTWD
ncbi:unnamed protein product [Microthlaspi erraticum]|uniref:Subtilisin-like protease fibronectin type-III domain-containing protein n=1 Tax=Microthlaspi erraticum TaxID=1685480 RepID=A0A6D2I8C3_9BRAS|nr:unnamed protein product [Microthlaspi erraticum]